MINSLTKKMKIQSYSYKKRLCFRICAIFCLIFLISYLLSDNTASNQISIGNIAYGESITIPVTTETAEEITGGNDIAQEMQEPPPILQNRKSASTSALNDNDNYTVQAVLGAKDQIVLASSSNSKIIRFNFESGDRFKRGDVLIEYDCSLDNARLSEALSRQRVTEKQLAAYQKLTELNSASEMELVVARENNEQNKAVISQIRSRLKSCKHVAPWNGRVMRTMASQYEYVQTGRVLMEIASSEPLRAEFLIPSRWLRWLNIGTPLDIYIGETDRTYTAEVINIFGEVDPVSQSIQVVAEMQKYHEDLLPGMSGRTSFKQSTTETGLNQGFLGLMFSENKAQ